MKHTDPILITGVPRSGATFIARILEMCGANVGVCSNMYENLPLLGIHNKLISYEEVLNQANPDALINFKANIQQSLEKQGISKETWLFKTHLLTLSWKYWHSLFPKANWIVVRRKTPHIINSCEKTGYMRLMRDEVMLQQIKAKNEREGWLWLIHWYENEWVKMYQNKLNIIEVYPDRMADNDYSRIQKMVEDLGLTWTDNVVEKMNPYFTDK